MDMCNIPINRDVNICCCGPNVIICFYTTQRWVLTTCYFIALEPTLGSYYNIIYFLWWTQHWVIVHFIFMLDPTLGYSIYYFCGGPNVGL